MKKLMTLLAMISILLVGCGGNTSKGDSSNTIKIGVIAPLTGDLAQYGTPAKDGFQLKIDEINAAGGINGKKIELIIEDNKGDINETVNIFKRLVGNEKVNLVVGPVISSTSNAAGPLAQKAKVVMITPTGTNMDITKDKDFVFRTTFTDPYQGTAAAKYAAKNGIKKVAIMTNTASDYSVGLAAAFKEEAQKSGIEVMEEKYNKDDKDFKSILTNIKNKSPEAIFIPDYYNTIGLIITQAKEVGIKAQYLGGDGWDGVQKDFGQIAEGAVFASQFAADDTSEIVQKFIKSYKESKKVDPNVFAALGYDTGSIIEAALKSAKDTSSEGLRDAVKAVNLDLVTGKLVFDENRNPEKAVTFVQVKGGKVVLKEKVQ
jgi:branched-chain amino acid transport system substrate-binding protein